MSSADLETEAIRIFTRYAVEIVEAFDLCPWAKRVREADRIEHHVFSFDQLTKRATAAATQAIEDVARRPEIEIAVLLFPLLEVEPRLFRRFVSELETEHGQAHPRGGAPLGMAAFHPLADANVTSADRLVPFIRRSPDPTVQLVRLDTLAAARRRADEGSAFATGMGALGPMLGKAAPVSVSDRIAGSNLRTVERVGVGQLNAIFEDIAADRVGSYSRVSRVRE